MSTGSSLCNLDFRNSHIIRDHFFWEIHNGNTTLFWEESWKQLSCLDHNNDLQGIKFALDQLNARTIEDFGKASHGQEEWRMWKIEWDWQIEGPQNSWSAFNHLLQERRIPMSQASNKLRWAYKALASFSIKEAYLIKLNINALSHESY